MKLSAEYGTWNIERTQYMVIFAPLNKQPVLCRSSLVYHWFFPKLAISDSRNNWAYRHLFGDNQNKLLSWLRPQISPIRWLNSMPAHRLLYRFRGTSRKSPKRDLLLHAPTPAFCGLIPCCVLSSLHLPKSDPSWDMSRGPSWSVC